MFSFVILLCNPVWFCMFNMHVRIGQDACFLTLSILDKNIHMTIRLINLSEYQMNVYI